MATLTIPFTFVAGTAAKAAEVNANFDAVESWSQGNIGTDNIGVLYSRSVPLPISPANAILNISQSSNNQALYISNAGTVSPIQIAQSGQLASSNAILKIDSTGLSQTVVGAAELLINSHVNTTIPTLLVNHGAVETLRLTKTALNVGSAVTTTLGGPLVLSNPAVTGPINLSGNLTVTGKETINRTSTNQFLELANTTTSKSLTVTPETSSFDLNINDVSSAYQFKINGVTKARIDNTGIDASYLSPGTISNAALASTTLLSDSGNFGNSYTFTWNDASNHLINQDIVLYSKTFAGVAGRPVIFNMVKNGSSSYEKILFYWQLEIRPLTSSGTNYQVFGGWGGVGPQIQGYISFKFNGVEISRMGYHAFPNGNYGSAGVISYYTYYCDPFTMIVVPTSTGNQTFSIEVKGYGNIYGNGYIKWAGVLYDANLQIITF